MLRRVLGVAAVVIAVLVLAGARIFDLSGVQLLAIGVGLCGAAIAL